MKLSAKSASFCSGHRNFEASSTHDAAEKGISLQGSDHRLTSAICEAQGNIMTMSINFRNEIEIYQAIGGPCGRGRIGIE